MGPVEQPEGDAAVAQAPGHHQGAAAVQGIEPGGVGGEEAAAGVVNEPVGKGQADEAPVDMAAQ